MGQAQKIQVAAVILFDGPLMLINLRPEGGYFGGWWEWPGGKREGNETIEQCARRELKEEIGLEAGPLRVFDQRVAHYPGREVELTFFVGNPKPGFEAAANALQHRWVLPQEVLKLRFLEPNLPVLQRLMDGPPPLA